MSPQDADIHGIEAQIADVAVAAGFANQSHFTRAFRTQMGVTPHALRIKNQVASAFRRTWSG